MFMYACLDTCECMCGCVYLCRYVCSYVRNSSFVPSLTLGLEGIAKGEKMSVRVWGNPSPFAVGCSMVSWEIIEMGGTYV